MKALIRFYQRHLTQHTAACPNTHLSCSDYGLAMVSAFGAVRGGALALHRIARCGLIAASMSQVTGEGPPCSPCGGGIRIGMVEGCCVMSGK